MSLLLGVGVGGVGVCPHGYRWGNTSYNLLSCWMFHLPVSITLWLQTHTARSPYGVGQGSVLTAEGMDYHGDQSGSACDSSLVESCGQQDFLKCRVLPSAWCLRLSAVTMFDWEWLTPRTAIATLAAAFWTGGLAAACTGSFYLMVSSSILILRREWKLLRSCEVFQAWPLILNSCATSKQRVARVGKNTMVHSVINKYRERVDKIGWFSHLMSHHLGVISNYLCQEAKSGNIVLQLCWPL